MPEKLSTINNELYIKLFNSNSTQIAFVSLALNKECGLWNTNYVEHHTCKYKNIMLFAGWEVCTVKNCDCGLEKCCQRQA